MCNRYALTKKQERIITREYGSLELYFMERFNIAPTQSASVVLVENEKLVTREMRWGLKVKWTKAPLLNAQRESLEKPVFRATFEAHRCLVPASGFYEWTIFQAAGSPFALSFRMNACSALQDYILSKMERKIF
jgi:putative SOS response-associated peptidase YedK